MLFQRNRTFAIVIILVFCGVQTANALGRSSGGRYIVPVDWIVLLFYFAGLLYLLGKLDFSAKLVNENGTGNSINWKQLGITIPCIFLIGALPVFYERLSIALIPRPKVIQSAGELRNLPGIDISNQDVSGIAQFLDRNHAISLQGAVFYPIQQSTDLVHDLPLSLTNNFQGQLLSFELIPSDDSLIIYFPYQGTIDIQNCKDKVYLTGCKIRQVLIVRDLVIIRSTQTKFLQSSFSFDSCQQLQSR